jgi:hypothetical protein
VSVRRLPLPAELARGLQYALPANQALATDRPVVKVRPRDADGRRSAAWCADHYEITAFYHVMDQGSLDVLEPALAAYPGVYLTSQIIGDGNLRGGTAEISNPDWPPLRDRSPGFLRPQVRALIRDTDRP